MVFKSLMNSLVLSASFFGENVDHRAKDQPELVVRSSEASIGDVSVGMTRADLEERSISYESDTRLLEGDKYNILRISLDGEEVVALMNLEGKIHRLETSSAGLRDRCGVGVGSSFSEVRGAYPQGRMVIEYADGRVANYVTGTHLIFVFDPSRYIRRALTL